MSDKSLLEQWRDMAYDQKKTREQLKSLWDAYFEVEKGVYEQLLAEPDTEVKGSVKELAEKYGMDVMTMVGFLDGINDSLKEANPIETMEEDTVVSLAFDKEKLYKNMVDARAEWLYELPQWNSIFDEETRKRLFLEQRKSGTIRKEKKIGRNDPCPCGSGKKYKKCCGRNAEKGLRAGEAVYPAGRQESNIRAGKAALPLLRKNKEPNFGHTDTDFKKRRNHYA